MSAERDVIDGLIAVIRSVNEAVTLAAVSTHTALPNTSATLAACRDLMTETLQRWDGVEPAL